VGHRVHQGAALAGAEAVQMLRYVTSLSAGVMQRIRHFGDFVTIPLAIAVFLGLAGMYRLPLVFAGGAVWTLLEYLVHRFAFHHYHSIGQRLHQLHHDHPSDPDSERSSLSTPLLAFPVGLLLIHIVGVQDGSAIFAGVLIGYLVFIYVHYAVHRRPVPPASWLYSAKMRHLTHHRFDNCNYGVTMSFWDVVFRTNAGLAGERISSETGTAD
jgi:sterol desaturase/sphingolipid hydroxylase (fatty acid hydroxylase superfamily)